MKISQFKALNNKDIKTRLFNFLTAVQYDYGDIEVENISKNLFYKYRNCGKSSMELFFKLVNEKKEIPKEEIETPKTDSIVESVVNQFKERSEVGVKKYNTTLDRTDLSTLEWINHAQQEAMDFVLYLEKLKKQYDN